MFNVYCLMFHVFTGVWLLRKPSALHAFLLFEQFEYAPKAREARDGAKRAEEVAFYAQSCDSKTYTC